MVLHYLKGFLRIKCVSSILFCGSIEALFYSDIWYLTIGIKALSLADIVDKYFYFFCRFCFWRRKKRAATFQKFLLYLCAKFAETGCIYEFLSKNYPSWKNKSSEMESGKSIYCSFKICNFLGFFPRTVA